VGPSAGYTVTGDVVNTAHRLASAAEPGEVLVADRTRQACAGSIGFRGRRVLELKGKREPVESWIADRVLTVPVERDDRGSRLPLVGRQTELDALHRKTLGAFESRRAELIAVVGEPGVGKTRLATELAERFDASPASGQVVWATCSPYGSEGDLSPVGELVRGALDIDRGLDRADQDGLLRHRLASLDLRDAVLRRRLGDLLGLGDASDGPVDTEPATGRGSPGEQHLAAASALFVAIAERRPVVLVVDDLHWGGSQLVRFLVQLPDRAAGERLVVLALGRDDVLERHGPLLGGRRVSTHTLEPLTESATAALIRSVLSEFADDGRVGPDALSRLVRAAGGNPLLVDQLVRFLVESGRLVPGEGRWTWHADDAVSDATLPDGIRSLIGARLDALPTDDRALLADAAVFGRVFWRSALVETIDDADDAEVSRALRRLAARGLIEPDPAGDDDTWRFRHSLARDVAYAGIPLAERAERHAIAARWIERRARTYLDAGAIASVAHHYERAVALGRAVDHVDSGLVRPAFAALLRAARDEQRREGLRRADRWYRRARSVGSADPDLMIEAVAEHGQVLLQLGQLDQAQETFEELGRRAGTTRPPMAALAEAHLGAVARLQGDLDLARERFQGAVSRWRDLDDLQGVADALRLEGWAEFTAGRPRAAVPRLERAAAIEQQLDEPVRHSDTLRLLGWCEYLDGRLVAAEEHLRTATAEAQENGEDGTAAFCLGLLGHVLLRSGRATEALTLARDLRELASSGTDPWGAWTVATLEAASLLALGDAEGAWTLGSEALARFEELDDDLGLGLARMVVAQSARARGDREGARRILTTILDAGRAAGVPASDARAQAELAALEIEADRLEEAERRARSSLVLVRAGIADDESGLKALRVLARVAVPRGEPTAPALRLAEAAAPREPGDRTEGWRLAAIALADLRLARGDRDGAAALVAAVADPPCDIVRVAERLGSTVERLEAS
jgi:tetratricopeptide (TPR) repeat protein